MFDCVMAMKYKMKDFIIGIGTADKIVQQQNNVIFFTDEYFFKFF